MNGEMKVGVFVLIGSVFFGAAIFLLGNYSFQKYYTVYAEFSDVAGLPDKAVVKLSGVEVGKIKKIFLKDERVVVQLGINEGVKIYRNARFLVGSTSMIGSKFMQIDQGSPATGIIEAGATMLGEESPALDRALARAVTSLEALVGDIRGEGRLARDLNEILTNLREVTGNVNELVSNAQPHAEKIMERMDSITAKLDAMLTKTDAIAGKMARGDGVAGALISDQKMKTEVSSSITNLRDASASVKDVLGRVSGFRTYLRWDYKYEPAADSPRNNFGLKIYPRAGRYYYLGAANMVNTRDIAKGADYETLNSVDAQLGWDVDAFDLYAGVLRGSGGFGLRWKPFYQNPEWDRISAMVEASEFTRNRAIKGRNFNDPRYDAGVDVVINKYISAGLRLNDMAETKRLNYVTRLVFEDKDISYLLGFASLGSLKR